MRVIDVALKDLLQIVRDWRAAAFLVIMPIAFTIMFGFAFGGIGDDGPADARLPVGLLDEDGSTLSAYLRALLDQSVVIRIEPGTESVDELEDSVLDGELAAAIIIPLDYGETMVSGEAIPVTVIANSGDNAGRTAQGEIAAAANRLSNALTAANISAYSFDQEVGFADETQRELYRDRALTDAVEAWSDPPVTISTSKTGATEDELAGLDENAFAQSSPGMMAQFAVAGLMGAAALLVLERKNRALQRLLTTPISKAEILLGHYLAMFVMIFVQMVILITFGQLLLQLDYFGAPLATLSIAITTALFAASLGLLIGAVATGEEQVILISLIAMFVLAGLGGAWVPLEITPETFQRIAFFTPLAWVMDGFKDIIIRGLGLESVLLAAGVLTAYALVLFALAVWRFRFE